MPLKVATFLEACFNSLITFIVFELKSTFGTPQLFSLT